ncbi:hypothetical protein TWF694_005294 [Orbilia ellipsospora]|uniref:Uncharacterized protein n=1 Tax=Orbilia ellipsospora TaxID=2528407 RepID=A0AAV9WSR3_9PEZI
MYRTSWPDQKFVVRYARGFGCEGDIRCEIRQCVRQRDCGTGQKFSSGDVKKRATSGKQRPTPQGTGIDPSLGWWEKKWERLKMEFRVDNFVSKADKKLLAKVGEGLSPKANLEKLEKLINAPSTTAKAGMEFYYSSGLCNLIGKCRELPVDADMVRARNQLIEDLKNGPPSCLEGQTTPDDPLGLRSCQPPPKMEWDTCYINESGFVCCNAANRQGKVCIVEAEPAVAAKQAYP